MSEDIEKRASALWHRAVEVEDKASWDLAARAQTATRAASLLRTARWEIFFDDLECPATQLALDFLEQWVVTEIDFVEALSGARVGGAS